MQLKAKTKIDTDCEQPHIGSQTYMYVGLIVSTNIMFSCSNCARWITMYDS